MRRIGLPWIRLALGLFGLIMLGVGYQHTNPFSCETQGFPNCFGNSNAISLGTSVIGWGVLIEIAGGALVAIGLGFVILPHLHRRGL